jgi:thioredoxin 1
MVTELNEAQFNEFVKQSGIVMVDCWAPWCGPCRRMGPVVEELANDLAGKVAVAKLNTDENQAIAVRFDINAIPTLLVFKDNVLVESLVGLRPKEDIVDFLNSLRFPWNAMSSSSAAARRACRPRSIPRGRRSPPS